MKIDLNPQEARFVVDSIDAFVKQHGLAAAGAGLTIASRIQFAAQEEGAEVQPQSEEKEDATDS